MNTLFAGIALSLALCTPARAQESVTPPRPVTTPETYVVKDGDTLWDIAARFRADPFTWPDIWKQNDFIADPHWIYPGQILLIGPDGIRPAPPSYVPPAAPLPEPEPAPIMKPDVAPPPVEAPTPRVEAPVDPDLIRMFAAPRPVYTAMGYARAGFISPRGDLPTHSVAAIDAQTAYATRNDYVDIDLGTADGLKTGALLYVMGVGDRVRHPDTGRDMGVVVRVKGLVRVESTGETRARCRITDNFDPVEEGDLVMPAQLAPGPMADAWVRPGIDIATTIVAVNEPMISIHTNDILFIDTGARAGVRPGDRFTVYGPDEGGAGAGHRDVLGELEAVRVMPDHAAAIVVGLTDKGLSVGDTAELSARCRLVE